MRLASWSVSVLLGVGACGSDPGIQADGLADGGVSGGGLTAGDGSTAGGSTGGGSTGGGSGGGDGGLCQKSSVDNGRVVPDMLIVLDRSGSMKMNGTNRWDPSVNGLKAITAASQASVRFGLMAYPGTGAAGAPPPVDCSTLTDFVQLVSCFVNAGASAAGGDTCSAGHIDVPIALNNADAIASALSMMSPGGATPTSMTLEAAHKVLGSGTANSGPDTGMRPGAKYVLLVTDGQPNCTSGGGGGGRGGDAAAVTASVAAIKAMADDGIKTYVLGYDAAKDANLAAVLDQMALAGGTGDTHARAVNDQASLVAEFSKIAGKAASCEFTLDQPPSDPDYVRVTLDGNELKLGDAAGWAISTDHAKVTVQGSACDLLLGKEQHVLGVTVECEQVTLH